MQTITDLPEWGEIHSWGPRRPGPKKIDKERRRRLKDENARRGQLEETWARRGRGERIAVGVTMPKPREPGICSDYARDKIPMYELRKWYNEYETTRPVLTRNDSLFMAQFPAEFRLWPTMFFERYPGLRPTPNPHHYFYGDLDSFGYGWHLRPERYKLSFDREHYDDYSKFIRLWPPPEVHGRRIRWEEASEAYRTNSGVVAGTLLTPTEVNPIPAQVIMKKRSDILEYDGSQRRDPLVAKGVPPGSPTPSSPLEAIIVSADQELLDQLKRARTFKLSPSPVEDPSNTPSSAITQNSNSFSEGTSHLSVPLRHRSHSPLNHDRRPPMLAPKDSLPITSSPVFARAHDSIVRRDPDWSRALRKEAPFSSIDASLAALKRMNQSQEQQINDQGKASEQQVNEPSDQGSPSLAHYNDTPSSGDTSSLFRSPVGSPLHRANEPHSEHCPTPGGVPEMDENYNYPAESSGDHQEGWDPINRLILNPEILTRHPDDPPQRPRTGGRATSSTEVDPLTAYPQPTLSQEQFAEFLRTYQQNHLALLQMQTSLGNPGPSQYPMTQQPSLPQPPVAQRTENVSKMQQMEWMTARIEELEQKEKDRSPQRGDIRSLEDTPDPSSPQHQDKSPHQSLKDPIHVLSSPAQEPSSSPGRLGQLDRVKTPAAINPISPKGIIKEGSSSKRIPASKTPVQSSQPAGSGKRSSSLLSPELLPHLKRMKFQPKEIAKDNSVMAQLDQRTLGKPLAGYIREMADPGRTSRRHPNWKREADLPVALKWDRKRGLTAGEIQTLLEYGPGVRKTFTQVFGGEGNLRRKYHHHLDLMEGERFSRPALALNSLTPDFVESYITRHAPQIQPTDEDESTKDPTESAPEGTPDPEPLKTPESKPMPNKTTGERANVESKEKPLGRMQKKVTMYRNQVDTLRKVTENQELIIQAQWRENQTLRSILEKVETRLKKHKAIVDIGPLPSPTRIPNYIGLECDMEEPSEDE